jgi:hypothetical protein
MVGSGAPIGQRPCTVGGGSADDGGGERVGGGNRGAAIGGNRQWGNGPGGGAADIQIDLESRRQIRHALLLIGAGPQRRREQKCRNHRSLRRDRRANRTPDADRRAAPISAGRRFSVPAIRRGGSGSVHFPV